MTGHLWRGNRHWAAIVQSSFSNVIIIRIIYCSRKFLPTSPVSQKHKFEVLFVIQKKETAHLTEMIRNTSFDITRCVINATYLGVILIRFIFMHIMTPSHGSVLCVTDTLMCPLMLAWLYCCTNSRYASACRRSDALVPIYHIGRAFSPTKIDIAFSISWQNYIKCKYIFRWRSC